MDKYRREGIRCTVDRVDMKRRDGIRCTVHGRVQKKRNKVYGAWTST